MNGKNEMTAPIASVGADAGQSLDLDNSSITKEADVYNEKMQKMVRELQRVCDPAYLNTFSMNDLYDQVFTGRPPIIDGLLYSGTYLLAGAPKIGKSFLVAQLAYHVSTGQTLWEYPVRQGGVLYLALEDDKQRLQERMSRMFGVEGTDNLNFAIGSGQVGDGLDIQLDNYLHEHSDTRLIIIDTLQKVRGGSGDLCSYANDYEDIGQLKQFADHRGICLLLVHHTRKQPAGDAFDMISGTTGLLGCADGALLLRKEKRTDLTATLDIVGRDQPDQRLHLTRDQDKLIWQLDHAETELWKPPPEPFLEKIAALLSEDKPTWTGSATELAALLGEEMKPNILTRRLNVKHGRLKSEYGISYTISRNRNGSCINLKRVE